MEGIGKTLEKPKYLAISAAVLLVTAFVLVQPTLNRAYAVGIEGLPVYDDCDEDENNVPQDAISMNTVRSGNIVKTVHAEKEIFICFLEQGDLEVIVDLTTYLEVYEDITSQEVIETNAVATTCIKDEGTAQVIDCESYGVSTSPVFVGSSCEEETEEEGKPLNTHPQEMNTVTKGKLAKTIEAQKEIFECDFETDSTEKKVDIVLFTEIYEDLNTQETTDVQFLSARCVVLRTDEGGDLQDAFVESCIFSEIEN
ncbi:MAG: hypothetical protein HMLIMOIP_000445 [Candidatus Nitrosomirales archaeon]|jgi:hypothetical protein